MKHEVDKRQDEEIQDIQKWRERVDRVMHGDPDMQWKGMMKEHKDLSDHVGTIETTLTELLLTTKNTGNYIKWTLTILGGIGTVLGILKAIGLW